jgi:hypothetical protein
MSISKNNFAAGITTAFAATVHTTQGEYEQEENRHPMDG